MSFGFPDNVLIDGERIDANVASRVLSAKLIRPYSGATSIELELADPGGLILKSGLLSKSGKPTGRAKTKPQFAVAPWAQFGNSRLVINGVAFRLAAVQPSYGVDGDRLTTTWEDEAGAKLRHYKRRVVYTRSRHMTRAQFIYALCTIARVVKDIPERTDAKPIAGTSPHARAKAKRKGIDKNADLTIKGVKPTARQIRLLEQILAQADEDKASVRAAIAMLCAAIGESGVAEIPNSEGSNYHGVFQGSKDVFKVTDTELMAHYFLVGGKGFQSGGAIKAAAENPSWSPGTIAYKVEGSISNFASVREAEHFYGQWENEANAILDAWGGVGRVVLDRQEREFRNAKGTTFFDTAVALAEEVGARFFATENVVNYVSDDYLIGLEPVFAVGRRDNGDWLPGMISVSGPGEDVGMPISELTVKAHKPLWTGRAGIPVTAKGMGPLDGRWLIANVEEDLFEHEPAEITLRRPTPLLPEPAAFDKIVRTDTTPERGSARERILRLAKSSMTVHTGFSRYSQLGETTFDPTPPSPKRTDCSQWTRAIYHRAGLPDIGLNTTGQNAQGRRTSDPRPGDLMMLPGHVEIYIGSEGPEGFNTIGHGSPPIDYGKTSFFPGHWFVTFDFLDD